MTLHANNFVCRSNGVICGQYKDKEGKTLKKRLLKAQKKRQKFKISKNGKKSFPIVLKNIFSKN